MKIVAVSTNLDNACAWWRITRPLEMLKNKYNVEVEYVQIDNYGEINVDIKGAIVILQRLVLNNPQEFIYNLRQKGAEKIIYELDDDIITENYIEHIKKCGRYSDAGLQKISNNRNNIHKTMYYCDAITVSTIDLSYVVQKYTEVNCFIIDNGIDVEWFESRLKPVQINDDKIKIGWAGGFRPNADLEQMAKAWAIIKAKYKNDVEFIVAGWQADVIYEHLELEDIKKVKWQDLDGWPNSMQMDIGCTFLEDNEFNMCRSGNKYYEYTLAGATTLASFTAYDNVIMNQNTGVLTYNKVDSIVNELENLLNNKNKRNLLLSTARRELYLYSSLERIIEERYNIYEDILNEN